jgi:NAD+ synthase
MLPIISPKQETKKTTDFIKKTLQREKFNKVVIGLSGGIDSTVCYYLLKQVLPEKNILTVRMNYNNKTDYVDKIIKSSYRINIKNTVDSLKKLLQIDPENKTSDRVRLGNVMARTRMIILFDLAKKNQALVCGTENKSERLLGYFTRYGDQSSDIEPIIHLYKTQVLQLAKYLKVPEEIIKQTPTAGLWLGQTDEGEFGFTYKEANQVLYLYFDQKKSLNWIKKQGFANAEKIIGFAKKNEFKHKVPYFLP